jgi:magnesium transporter
MSSSEHTQGNLTRLREQLESGRMRSAKAMLNSLHPAEIGHLLESLPRHERALVWEILDPDIEGDVLVEVAEAVRDDLIRGMPVEELIAAVGGMELDDLADLVADLPEAVTLEVVQSLNHQDQERLRQVLRYDEDSAGGLMNVDIVTVRPDVTAEVVFRYLRTHRDLPDGTDSIFVVDRKNRYLGTVYLSRLLKADPGLPIANIMSVGMTPIQALASTEQVVWEFEHRDLLSAPVVDQAGVVVGRITVDDVLDEIRDEAEHSLMSAAGLDEEDDMFAPVVTSALRRALWLGVNLATAFLAASVVDLFQTTIDKIVLLAVLMPVVPSMGGVAGTQSLTIITRALALKQIDLGNARRILRKELAVGLLNGIAWASVVAIATYLWFDDWRIGAVIAAAMVINMVVAAFAGFSIPLVLKKMHIDPALAGGVVLTTVTDVIGYAAFLGLGAAFLL